MRGVREVMCSVCDGTGMLQTITTVDVLQRGKEIVEEVATEHRLSIAEMVGPSRQVTLVQARRDAARRMRTETSLTLKAIGLLLGRRDHATVVNLIQGPRTGYAQAADATYRTRKKS